MKTQQLRPRVLVSYVREPYVYAAGNVRVTFDSNIRTSLFQRDSRFSGPIAAAAAAGETGVSMAYETELFDTSSILTVNILMDDADSNDMIANAAAEEYYHA